MAVPFQDGFPQFFDNNGAPLAGGKLYTYAAGTLTPLATYTTQAGAVANANPVILDSAGRASVWMDQVAYRVILKDSADNTLKDVDNLQVGGTVGSGLVSYAREKQTATAAQTAFNLTISYTPSASSLVVIVDGLVVPESDYTQTSSTVVTFAAPMAGGEEVEFIAGRLVSAGLLATAVSFEQTSSGVTRTVQAKLREVIYSSDYNVTGDGVTDDTTALQAAFTAAAGKTLVLTPGHSYLISARISVAGSQTVIGYGSRIVTASNITGIEITSSDVSVFGLEIEGVGNASYNSSGRLIYISGTDGGAATAPTRISGVTVRDCVLHDAGRCGIFAQFAEKLRIEDNRIYDVGYAGVEFQSVNDSRATGNDIRDVTPGSGSNTYGVYVSQTNNADTVRYPTCKRVAVTGNTIENVEWEGIDCHGGSDLDFSHNIITNCGDTNAAIAIIHGDDETSTPIAPAYRVRVIGNTITGAQNYGIATSASTVIHEQISIIGNTLNNCGSSAASSSRGAIRIGSAMDVSVSANSIKYVAPYGVIVNDALAENVSISGNTFDRVVSNTVTTPAPILIDRGASGTGAIIISGNTLRVASEGDTYEAVNGVRVVSTDGGNIRIDTNQFDAATTKYSMTAAQTEKSSAPVANFGEDSIAVTTSVATASKVITLTNPHSANTVYVPFAVIYGATGNTNALIHATRTSTSTITVTVYTAGGANFAASGNINFYFQTVGY